MLCLAGLRLVKKYVYISDNHLTGYAENADTVTVNGIEMDSQYQVLTEVFGV